MHINPIIERFSANPLGRDFIVGDIHGCFDLFIAELKKQNFKPGKDRVFTVGDLVDRGPKSAEAYRWLRQDWFHSCLGNHEESLLNLQTDNKEGLRWFESHGGEWWLALNNEQRAAMRAVIGQLPVVIEIETKLGRVALIHAEIPKNLSWPDFVKQLEAGDSQCYQSSLWGRKRIGSFFSPKIKGIDHLVCGHSIPPKKKVLKKGNIWFIETGAYLEKEGGHLTVLNIEELFEK